MPRLQNTNTVLQYDYHGFMSNKLLLSGLELCPFDFHTLVRLDYVGGCWFVSSVAINCNLSVPAWILAFNGTIRKVKTLCTVQMDSRPWSKPLLVQQYIFESIAHNLDDLFHSWAKCNEDIYMDSEMNARLYTYIVNNNMCAKSHIQLPPNSLSVAQSY